jgi:hypothetical protein
LLYIFIKKNKYKGTWGCAIEADSSVPIQARARGCQYALPQELGVALGATAQDFNYNEYL